MQFLADIELPCEECNGTRYKSAILDIKYKNKNIHDVLNMTVKEALHYFAGHPKIVDKLDKLVVDEVGLRPTSASASPPPPSPAAKPSASN